MILRAPATPSAATALRIAALAAFDFESDAYGDLLARARVTAFQAPGWLAAFYRHLAPALRAEPLIVVGRDGDGVLQLVVPLLRREAAGLTRIDYAFGGVCDYALPVAARGLDLAAATAGFLRALGPHDLLAIAPVRAGDAETWQGLFGCAPEALSFGSHLAVSPGDSLAWPVHRPGSSRIAGLARKARRLAELGPLRLQIVAGPAAADALRLAAELRRGRFADDPLQSVAGRAFYAEVAARADGAARTYVMTCGDDTVGILFGLVDGGCFRYLVLGCDYARFGRFSPGMILFDRVMAAWFGAGGTAFDFTIGDEPFKSEFGAVRAPMCRFLRPVTPQGAALAEAIRAGLAA